MTPPKKIDNSTTAKIKRFNFFPWKQDICLVYSKDLISSELFQNLYIQISPKNSFFFRILLSKVVIHLRSYFKKELDTPKSDTNYLGILKKNKSILFEMKNNQPTAVWKKTDSGEWVKSDFLGYQLISNYTVDEFNRKYDLIKRALQLHWESVNNDLAQIHGDLTHFNILYDKKFFFIDKKSTNHSKLFDFFYFYAYLNQCINRCSTLGKIQKKSIINRLKLILKDVCKYDSKNQFEKDFKSLKIPKTHGINDLKSLKKDFFTIFII